VFHILHRMIFLELVRVFLLALVTLTGLLLMAGIVTEASQRGLPPEQILSVIPLLIPNTLPYTIPTTTLFATCIVYGRLAADNEVLALKAAGINMVHVVWPAVFLGLSASAATFAMAVDLIPSTHHALRSRFLDDIEEFLYAALKREGYIRHPKIPYEIHVKRVEGRKLIDAIFTRREPKGKHFDIIARAREAVLQVDKNRGLVFVHMRHCVMHGETGVDTAVVDEKTWPVELPDDFNKDDKLKNTPREMTWHELLDHRDRLILERDRYGAEMDAHQALINQGGATPTARQHLRNLNAMRNLRTQQVLAIDAELQMRPALSLGCLCFVLIGCPVGIWFSRSDYLSAFITCFLPVVLVYYPLLLCGINMARLGRIDPVPALWAANALMAVVALFLFRRLMRH
jgi:lipopolysaccharide export system permease protein